MKNCGDQRTKNSLKVKRRATKRKIFEFKNEKNVPPPLEKSYVYF
jgi:hypothetical protein